MSDKELKEAARELKLLLEAFRANMTDRNQILLGAASLKVEGMAQRMQTIQKNAVNQELFSELEHAYSGFLSVFNEQRGMYDRAKHGGAGAVNDMQEVPQHTINDIWTAVKQPYEILKKLADIVAKNPGLLTNTPGKKTGFFGGLRNALGLP